MGDLPRRVKVTVEVIVDPENLNWHRIGESQYAAMPFCESIEMDTTKGDDALRHALDEAVRIAYGVRLHRSA